jgi:UTP-glucose-1-phosphate uridylyltransferase
LIDTSYELEALLEQRVKRQLLAEVQAICPPGVTITASSWRFTRCSSRASSS